jgi:hypothetical protein
MATFEITDPGGGTYHIDAPDASSAMSAFSQMKGGGAGAAPAPLDKYQQAAADKLAKLKAAGGPDMSYGPAESFINGRMLGGLSTAMAIPGAIAQKVTNPDLGWQDAWNYAKAEQEAMAAAGNAAHPIANTVASMAGGGMTGAGASRAGLTLVPQGAGTLRTMAGMAGEGAAYGGASGFLSGEGEGRFTDAAKGAVGGGLTGLALTPAAAVASTVFRPAIGRVSSWIDPEGTGRAALARVLRGAGLGAAEVDAAVARAAREGQPDYTVADALGKSGRGSLSNIVRTPGEAGQQASEFLQARQLDQGRDVATAVEEGLDVRGTAEEARTAMTRARTQEADTNYGTARGVSGSFNATPVLQEIDRTLTPGAQRVLNPQTGLPDTPIEAALQRVRNWFSTGNEQVSDFQRAFDLKRNLDGVIGVAVRQGDNALAARLESVKTVINRQLEEASAPYRQANDAFAERSRNIEAIDTGRRAATSGRTNDILAHYLTLPEEGQGGFNTGWADTRLGQIERGNPNADKTLRLRSDAARTQLEQMAGPERYPLMAGRLQRSADMNATFRRAMTGSDTSANLAEGAEHGMDIGAIVEAAHGNVHGLALDLARRAFNAWSGTTPAVRQYLVEALLRRGEQPGLAGYMALRPNDRISLLSRAIRAGGQAGIPAAINAQSTSEQPSRR